MSTGLLEQRQQYRTGYEYGPFKGETDHDNDGKKEIDCSGLLYRMLKDAGYTIPYLTTSGLNTDTTYFDVIPLAEVQPGDIALWINFHGHTGVIEDISGSPVRDRGNFFGSQSSNGPKSAKYGAGSGYWPMPEKFLRPKPQFRGAQPAPAPTPAPAPAPAGPAPLMSFQYPFRKADGKQFSDADEIYKALENESAGHYLLGSNKFWHGGIHISNASAPQCILNEPIRCMADGEVVAYRLNEDYLESTFGEAEKKLKYSNSFCLVRHEYKSAPNPEEGPNKGKQNKLTFFSLYMHLLPFKRYPLSDSEIPKTKVTMKVSDFKAYDDFPATSSVQDVGKLFAGTKLEILEQKEVDNLTYAKGKILSGSVKKNSHKVREVGQEVWFVYLKDGEPYKNSRPARIWLADPIPERTKPKYWQGKVKGTAVKKLDLYQDPAAPQNGQPAGARMGTMQLTQGSVVEFDSKDVLNLSISGATRRMAKCTSSGSLAGAGNLPPSFWAIVENESVVWDVTPASFDSVVSASTGIKAGDPIGYLGLTDNLTGEDGNVTSKYQAHIEIFTDEATVKEFLENTAGLKIGKQYLHLVAGSELKKESPATGNITLSRNHAVDLGKAPVVKVGNEDYYQVNLVEDGVAVSGLMGKTLGAVITQHDWQKLGFQIVEETNETADGFLDPQDTPKFFKDLFAKIDTNQDGNVDAAELVEALKSNEKRDEWTKLVAYHPTEWKETADAAKWLKLDELLESSPKTLKHEKERISKYVFWNELSGKAAMATSKIWHFHPVAFIDNLLGAGCCELNLDNFKRIFGGAPLFTAPNMPAGCDAHNVDPQKFILLLNAAFKANGFDKCNHKAHFLAQCYHESDHFRTTKEYASGNDYDLSVHPASVCITEGQDSRTCKRHHQIMQEGNTAIGDGPKYKGKGLIQITWKSAYQKYKQHSGVDCVANPEILSQSIEHAVNVSFWFWTIFKGESLNKKIDRFYQELNAQGNLTIEQIDDEVVRKVTKVVNGGSNHLAERQALFKKIKGELK